MSDTLQLVVNVPYSQQHRNLPTLKAINECPIRFSLSSTFRTFNSKVIESIGAILSCNRSTCNLPNTLESIILTELNVGSVDDKLKRIGALLTW